MVRPPAVAGSFYPGEPGELSRLLAELIRPSPDASAATAVMVPHAGYVYSGGVAGAVFSSVRLPRRFIILCPNHTGRGDEFAIYPDGAWGTPLGEVPVDPALAGDLLSRFPRLRRDMRAHEREHSLEVQIPFLQHLVDEFRFVPVCIASRRLEDLVGLGEAIAEVVRECDEPVLLVISSDMSHYEPAETAREHDRRALDPLERLDAEGLHRVVLGEGISMCGIAPAVTGVAAARRLGARAGRLIAYANSGDASGDYESVVGYAGMVLA